MKDQIKYLIQWYDYANDCEEEDEANDFSIEDYAKAWLTSNPLPYELPTEEEIREAIKDFDICKFVKSPKHDFHSPYDASEELVKAIINLLKGEK